MNHCSVARILMTKRQHQPLAPEEGARLRQHLDDCPACQAEWARDTRFEQGLRAQLEMGALRSVPAEVDPDRVIRSLRRSRGVRELRRAAWTRLTVGGAAVAGLALGAAIPHLSTRVGRETHAAWHPGRNSAAGAKPREAERTPRLISPSLPDADTIRRLPPNIRRGPGTRLTHAPDPGGSAGEPGQPVWGLGDAAYLDGRDPALLSRWMLGKAADPAVLTWARRKLPRMRDDFVRLPLPLFASGDTNSRAAGEALRNYEEEAKVVDARLFRKVTLSSKAQSLEELCARLSAVTGVRLAASRGVRDEKATVFVEDVPARDLMREVARLFGFFWSRSGEQNAYRYELVQDLRSQLAEEEMRSRDLHAALISLDGQMGKFRPFLDQDIDAVLRRIDRAQGGSDPAGDSLRRLVKGGGWGPANVYFRLTAVDRNALVAGERLRFTMNDPNPDRRLSAEWRGPLLKSSGLRLFPNGDIGEDDFPDKPSISISEVAGIDPVVEVRLDRSEAGEFSLVVNTHVEGQINGKEVGGGGGWVMARGHSTAADPENGKANAQLQADPLFQSRIDLTPKPSCSPVRGDKERVAGPDGASYVLEKELRDPHVSTADVWEEVHRRTHLPIIADSYTHLFRMRDVSPRNLSTFNALCQVGDRMGLRWKKDGEFLIARSTGYFWDKLKEVPNRLLRHWQEDRDLHGGMPLEDLFEMSGCSDQQLGSRIVGMGITHCWGLWEWSIIGNGPYEGEARTLPGRARQELRALRVLTPAQLRQARTDAGLSLDVLDAGQREVMAKVFSWRPNGKTTRRMQIAYIPQGRFIWRPVVSRQRYEEARRWPLVWGASHAEVMERARKYDPQPDPGSVRRTRGQLDIGWIQVNGERSGRFSVGISDD